MEKKWVSASDVEKYGYCPLSWWLSEIEEEVENKALEKGKEDHNEFTSKLKDVKEKEEMSSRLENLILWLAASATIVSILGLTFLRPERYLSQIILVNALIWLLAATFFLYISEKGFFSGSTLTIERIILIFAMVATILATYSLTLPISNHNIARIAQIISLCWLIGASYWLKRSLVLKLKAKEKRKELKVEEGEVEYVDETKEKSEMLISEKYRLRGRPDYILRKNGKKIPVEVKTGRVPEGPFFSHILQSAAYCFLLEEEEEVAPPYAIIKYGETEFEIDYDESLRELLINKLLEMKKIIEKDEAHRNHNRKGKCRNCSRREICPESLV
ncbi:MAG: CRISPR-associated protein Cas4 [Thermoplasmatota archaeon]